MSLPITSRIKRSPLLQTATTVGGKKGEDKNIKGKKGTPKRTEKEAYELRGPEYKDMDFAAYQKVMRNDPLYGTSGTPDQPLASKSLYMLQKNTMFSSRLKLEHHQGLSKKSNAIFVELKLKPQKKRAH
jgi:hypothetical protein